MPDLVDLIRVTRGATYGEETLAAPVRLRASVDEDARTRFGPRGEPLEPSAWIALPGGTVVSMGDYVTIVKVGGVAVSGPQHEMRKVRKVALLGSHVGSHVEVEVGQGGAR